MREDEKAEAKKILKKRDLARKGIEEKPAGEGDDAEANTKEREKALAANAVPIGIALRRSG